MPTAIERSLSIITQRWPDIATVLRETDHDSKIDCYTDSDHTALAIDDILISSLYDPEGEAALQATLIPPASPVATVYGIGNGALIRTLLQRDDLRNLDIVLLNPAVEHICLRHFPGEEWLNDPRIQLKLATNDSCPAPPFAALPAALRLADDNAARLRDQIQLELNNAYIRDNFQQRSSVFREQMRVNESRLRTDGDVASLFGSRPGATAVIAAAGPTLAQHYGRLRELRESLLVIAVDASLIPLLNNGITPDIVVTIDGSRSGIYPYFDTDLSSMSSQTLVYFPIVHPDVLERWPGPRLAAYANHSIYASIAERIPKANLFASGTVTHAATDLAIRMGAENIVFAGADFAFPNHRTHVEGSAHAQSSVVTSGTAWVHNGHNQRIATLPNLRAYLRDLEAYIAHHPQMNFYNASRDGARILGTNYGWPEVRA